MEPHTILVVDDDDLLRSYLETILHDEGFHVKSTASGKEAIDLVLMEKPQIMILDLTLPEVPGEEICRIIKSDPVLREIIIIILSGTSSVERKLACFDAGADEYLVKPIEPRELIARVRGFIRLLGDFKRTAEAPELRKDTGEIPEPVSRDQPYSTVDFVATATTESSARIKPKYGVYRTESLIGSGAMGHVFKAYDEPLERYVAVKILTRRLSNSPAFVERFRKEAKALAAINHPGIAFIYSFGEEEGDHYFAIQWCPGGSVADLVKKKGRIEVLPAAEIMLQSANALSAASKKGIVHRDIKPSNILFDENNQVKIVDFGLALAQEKKPSAKITQVQEFLGTPGFMPPEQAQSSAVDYRADIYSLGITFYYMLYGILPYNAGSAIEMVIKHASVAFPSFDDLGGTIPQHAYDIMKKMTEKNPEARYPDYASLITDLEQLRSTLLRESKRKLPRAERIDPVPSVKSLNLFDLLVDLYKQGSSGVLTARWATLQKRFLVRQREIVLFESSQTDENIWNFLAQRHLIKKEDVPAASESMEAAVNRFLSNQTFTLESFSAAYRELMKAALIQIFFWPVFEGDFANAVILHDSFSSVHISEILLEASRSLIDYQKVNSEIPLYGYICRTSQFEEVLSALNLKPEESFIASRLEEPNTTLNMLNLLTGLPDESIARFVYILEKMGAVKFASTAERPAGRRPETASAPPPPPPAASSKPTSPASSGTFARKPAPVKASRSDQAYLMDLQKKRFAEAPPAARKSSPELVEEVTRLTQQVRMEVIKSEKRAEEDHHIRVAEQFYELADHNFTANDYWKAIQLCKQAIKNNPTQAKYYRLMACAYAQHPRFGKDAEQSFYKAIELDPWNADYHMDLAQFYLQNGLSKRALNLATRALKLAPQHSEAKKLYTDLMTKVSK